MWELMCKVFGQKIYALIGAFFGALGLMNVIDSLIEQQLNITWTLVPDAARPIFELLRRLWRPLFDWVVQWLPLKFPDALKDYFLMGLVVTGMRWRSSGVIKNALKQGVWKTYEQKIFFTEFKIHLTKNSSAWKYYFVFLPVRLIPAFFVWPIRVVGAALRYATGIWKKGYTMPDEVAAREQQYISFFSTVVIAFFLLLVLQLILMIEVINK